MAMFVTLNEDEAKERSEWVDSVCRAFLAKLERMRLEQGLSQVDYLASFEHPVSLSSYSRMLNGKIQIPLDFFLEFCWTYGYDIKSLTANLKLDEPRDVEAYELAASLSAASAHDLLNLASATRDVMEESDADVRRRLTRALRKLAKSSQEHESKDIEAT